MLARAGTPSPAVAPTSSETTKWANSRSSLTPSSIAIGAFRGIGEQVADLGVLDPLALADWAGAKSIRGARIRSCPRSRPNRRARRATAGGRRGRSRAPAGSGRRHGRRVDDSPSPSGFVAGFAGTGTVGERVLRLFSSSRRCDSRERRSAARSGRRGEASLEPSGATKAAAPAAPSLGAVRATGTAMIATISASAGSSAPVAHVAVGRPPCAARGPATWTPSAGARNGAASPCAWGGWGASWRGYGGVEAGTGVAAGTVVAGAAGVAPAVRPWESGST